MLISSTLACVIAFLYWREWSARQIPTDPVDLDPRHYVPNLLDDRPYCTTCSFALWYTPDWVEYLFVERRPDGAPLCACQRLNEMYWDGFRFPRPQYIVSGPGGRF